MVLRGSLKPATQPLSLILWDSTLRVTEQSMANNLKRGRFLSFLFLFYFPISRNNCKTGLACISESQTRISQTTIVNPVIGFQASAWLGILSNVHLPRKLN